ncbi:MAG: hypothetical protein Q8878_08635, partial [Bacillota bacterium]|nr:hypothetical protein [Bacillota bacterium]
MTFLIISSMLLSFSLTAAFLYDYGKGLDDKARRIGQIKGKRREIDEELNIPLPQRFLRPVLSRFVKFFSRLLPKNGKENSGILKKIKMAGIKMPPEDFIAVRVMSMAGIAALSLLFAFLTPPRSPYRFFIVIY